MQRIDLNRDWRFHLGDPSGAFWTQPDPSGWRTLDLPHDWSIELPRSADAPSTASGGCYPMGRGWYAKTFTAPIDWTGKKVLIEFEGVYMNAEIWLNHHFVGRHPYGYTTFTCDLTPYLKLGEENMLTVFVNNEGQMNSRWYSGSGIYRFVWLMVGAPVHVAHWGVSVTTPEVAASAALVRLQTRIENEGDAARPVTLVQHILTPECTVAAKGTTTQVVPAGGDLVFRQRLEVADPLLWSPATPSLYRLETEVLVAGSAVDTASTSFGIRSISFSANVGFLLNGEPTLLRGGCVHHDNGPLGAASHARAEARKVELHKANGYNAIRCAHNPPSPAFLEACDRLGMLVIDEAFDCWREGKNPHDYHVAFDDWWQRDLDSMVLRDRNHPSIIMWSVGNEVKERDGRGGGGAIAEMLAHRVRELDPTRPVTAAICLVSDDAGGWEATDGVFVALDVGGYNYREVHYQGDHARHPDRVMVGLESTAMEALEHWEAVETLPYVIGDFVWTSLDYLGEAGIGRVEIGDEAKGLGVYPWHQANCGDLDLCGFKRPQSFYRDILWGRGQPLYMAVHEPVPEGEVRAVSYWGWPLVRPSWTWPEHEGETLIVDVYSASERVELLLNGRSLGTLPSGRTERHTATFEVPYEPGTLRAVGYNGEEQAAEWVLETIGPAARLRLTPDRVELDGPDDLSFVTVEAVNSQGRLDPNADCEVRFVVEGEGEIAAVGSGNPVTEESYRGNTRRAFHGRCLVVVKSSGTLGTTTLRAMADGLEAAEVTLKTVARRLVSTSCRL